MQKGDRVSLISDYKNHSFNYKKGQTGKVLFPVTEEDKTVVVILDGYEKEKKDYSEEIENGREGPNEFIWLMEFPIELLNMMES